MNKAIATNRPLRILAAGALMVATGCYTYVPARMDAVEPGSPVRLRLTAAEAERLEPIRQSDDRNLEGIVLSRGETELLLETTLGTLDPARGSRPLMQRVTVPLAEINEVEFRQRDNLKTGAAVGALGVAVGIGVAAAMAGGRGGPIDPTDPTPEFRRRPFVLRFAFGF